ncbi:MAG: hypothetical protein LBU86_05650 [Oscillospiraceae bacterium]|jgi:hypothetical protein|nr:hypothetical protein [Oscillospiraceae bacterium]
MKTISIYALIICAATLLCASCSAQPAPLSSHATVSSEDSAIETGAESTPADSAADPEPIEEPVDNSADEGSADSAADPEPVEEPVDDSADEGSADMPGGEAGQDLDSAESLPPPAPFEIQEMRLEHIGSVSTLWENTVTDKADIESIIGYLEGMEVANLYDQPLGGTWVEISYTDSAGAEITNVITLLDWAGEGYVLAFNRDIFEDPANTPEEFKHLLPINKWFKIDSGIWELIAKCSGGNMEYADGDIILNKEKIDFAEPRSYP